MKATKIFATTKNQANLTTLNSIATDKVAIFGGSFDPPHLAHFEIILWLSKHFGQVIVIPAYQNPLKNPATIPLQIRLQWCKKMCENIDNVIISDIEARNNRVMFAYELARHFYAKIFGKNFLEREEFRENVIDDFWCKEILDKNILDNSKKSNTQKSSTQNITKTTQVKTQKDSKTLESQPKQPKKSQNYTPPLYFVIGEDCLAHLHKWKNIDELSNLVDFVVFQRDNTKKSTQKKASQKKSTKSQKSSEEYFIKINPHNADLLDFANIHYIDFCPNALLDFGLNSGDISSTFLRKYLKQNPNIQDNNEQILQALPKNLRNEVLAFFAKTSLQF